MEDEIEGIKRARRGESGGSEGETYRALEKVSIRVRSRAEVLSLRLILRIIVHYCKTFAIKRSHIVNC